MVQVYIIYIQIQHLFVWNKTGVLGTHQICFKLPQGPRFFASRQYVVIALLSVLDCDVISCYQMSCLMVLFSCLSISLFIHFPNYMIHFFVFQLFIFLLNSCSDIRCLFNNCLHVFCFNFFILVYFFMLDYHFPLAFIMENKFLLGMYDLIMCLI